jgi:hypothetical protein
MSRLAATTIEAIEPSMSYDHENIRRVFTELFTAPALAEPLLSFDSSTSGEYVRSVLCDEQMEVAGVRESGFVRGYVEIADLKAGGLCGEVAQPIGEDQSVNESLPLAPLVRRLKEQPRVFVSALGQVGGIVTRDCLQKPPARMWLFGMITLIEMRFGRMIEDACPNESWQADVSEGRLQKASQLQGLRRSRGQHVSLGECLQFADKTAIIARNTALRSRTRFQSRREVEQIGKQLENLRNSLAHAQDIVASDWETIVALAEEIDCVLDGPPGLATSEGAGVSHG